MQILGINNYYQPKYINAKKQRKSYNINQLQSNPDSFTFRGIKVNGFKNIHAFKNIKNPENRAFFEQLKKNFKEVPYYRMHSWNDISSYDIERLYESCLDANDVVNKYAAQVLFNICHVGGKPPKELDIPEWNIKKEASKVFEDWSLEGVTTLLNDAKDKSGNHNINNLKFMLYVDKKVDKGSVPHDISRFIKACKNENGIITDENAKRFKSVNEKPYGEYLIYSSKDLMDTSDTGIKFVNRMLKYMAKAKGKNGYYNHEHENLEKFVEAVLEYNKSKEADKIYNILLENSDLVVKVVGKEFMFSCDIPFWVKDSFNSKKEMSSHNLKKLIEFKKNDEDELLENIDFLKDKMGYIRNENIEAYKKLNLYVQNRREQGYYDEEEQLWNVLNDEIKGYKNKNGVVNLEFANRIADICERYEFDSINGYIRNLFNIIRDFQNDKKPIDWDIVEMLCKYTKKAINADYTLDRHTIANLNNDVIRFIKDEKTSDIIPEKVEIFKKYADIDNPNSYRTMHHIQLQLETEDTLKNYFKNNSDYGNLYTADDMLELLRDMSEEGILNTRDILTTPIKEGDAPILMYIADILPTEENAKKYDKILKILGFVRNVDYNYKDTMGVSFLEKVMMSENEKLLDLIKDKPLIYYPELDYVYENIQNPEFKKKVSNINITLDNTENISNSKNLENRIKLLEMSAPLRAIALKNSIKE